MNTFSSLLQQQRGKPKNNLMDWLNKPAFQQIGANLAPIQKFVKRTTKGSNLPFYFGAQYVSFDDQTVDTTTTWEDRMRTTKPQQDEQALPRIKQTVVFINRGPPPTFATIPRQEPPTGRTEMEKRQRKSQQKNKALMLLQLEEVAAKRIALRQTWRTLLREEFFLEVFRNRIVHRRTIRLQKLQQIDERILEQRRVRPEQPLLDLEEYYRKFDLCLEELHDRNEIMELEAFKQLVIREIEERAESQNAFRERLKVVHGQLMQKFIMDDLIQGGLFSGGAAGPGARTRRRPRETLDEWIHISDDIEDQRNSIPQNPGEGSEWVVCDF